MFEEEDEGGFAEWLEENKNKTDKKGLTRNSSNKIRVVEQVQPMNLKPVKNKEGRGEKKVYVLTKYRQFDFMKYSLIVENWAKTQYGWSRNELGLIFYLVSEPFFTKEEFLEISSLLTFSSSRRFTSFLERGIISEIPRDNKEKNRNIKVPRLYKISFREKNRVSAIYDRLLLKTKISEKREKTKVFRVHKSSAEDKRMAKAIIKMNKEIDEIKNGKDSYLNDDFLTTE